MRSIFAAVLLLAGCGGAVPPVAPPPAAPPLPPVVAAPPAAPPDALPRAAPAPPVASVPAPSVPQAPPAAAEPLPPLTRPVVAVTVPGIGAPLVSVHGRSSRDVWFVVGEGGSGGVVRSDGRRVVKKYPPPRCGWGNVGGYFASGVVAGKEDVVLWGAAIAWARGPAFFSATLTRQGTWRCNRYSRTRTTFSSGDRVWELSCNDTHFGGGGFNGCPGACDCSLVASGGPSAALPSFDASFGEHGQHTPLALSALWMRGLDDGWMILDVPDDGTWLARYNGVTWVRRAAVDAGLAVLDLWVDDGGHPWIVARRGDQAEGPGNVVLRFDGHAFVPLPVPASFAATEIRGASARDVWFVGAGKSVFQWDGQRMRGGEAPFPVVGAWSSPDGELWMVGEGGKGVAAHTAPLAPVAPVAPVTGVH